ncbi:serine hydrolase domain-containing protein [Citreimonas salinaria]|uniref:CubicO group peptidase, beta-lactamase class C family n=1 Tax=Citreimonas salinaria TaxID=321339 RepID=A0A1H3ML11_9RHOB|nr:serine hydrolase [Citreimonas salinaria]SDY77371.1 CubicO group peptidase, beta-lactamase class C family [Citreimonas salinaria]
MSLDRALDRVEAAIDAGRIPGAVLGVIEGGERQLAARGLSALLPGKEPMREETVFDLASLTKVIFTTERILHHARAGRIDLDAPLITAIPDLRQYDMAAWERQVTFRQCLGHQTPFPAVAPIYTYGGDPATLRAFVLQREWQRRETPIYSDINYILLGIALERIEGRGIRAMDPGPGFTFGPAAEACAPTEVCAWRGRLVRGEVHDENCHALGGSGHAGLFGTGAAVLVFAQRLLHRGSGLIGEALSDTRTHGWERRHPGWSGGDACSPGTIGHTGFTGTGLWIDFDTGRAWTLLTNRVHPTRHAESGIADLRRQVGDALNGE